MLLIGKSQSGRGEVSSPQSLPRVVVVVVQLLFGGGGGERESRSKASQAKSSKPQFPPSQRQ